MTEEQKSKIKIQEHIDSIYIKKLPQFENLSLFQATAGDLADLVDKVDMIAVDMTTQKIIYNIQVKARFDRAYSDIRISSREATLLTEGKYKVDFQVTVDYENETCVRISCFNTRPFKDGKYKLNLVDYIKGNNINYYPVFGKLQAYNFENRTLTLKPTCYEEGETFYGIPFGLNNQLENGDKCVSVYQLTKNGELSEITNNF